MNVNEPIISHTGTTAYLCLLENKLPNSITRDINTRKISGRETSLFFGSVIRIKNRIPEIPENQTINTLFFHPFKNQKKNKLTALHSFHYEAEVGGNAVVSGQPFKKWA